jgi:hypothetical protein
MLTQGLTHGDDVCFRIVHLSIVFSRPAQADVDPGLENLVLFCEVFPFGHEHLKSHDGT